MALFMDFHEDLALYRKAEGQVYCLMEGPGEDAIRQHHAAPGVPAHRSTVAFIASRGCSPGSRRSSLPWIVR